MINVEKIKKLQKSSLFGTYVYYFPEIDSTNIYANRLAQEGAPEGTIVLSDFQTEGKGRMNRVWESSKEANILMSFVLRPKLDIERGIKITLATSEILISSLEKYLNKLNIEGISFSVKWPNDVLANGKKIAGILTESSLREKDIVYVVVGIGINVNEDLAELSDEVRDDATSLYAETGTLIDRESLIAELITEFERQYFNLERTNYEHVITDWKNRCHHLKKKIIIESHAGSEQGEFLDITEKGILVKLEGQAEGQEIIAGTIKSLKVVDGSDG